MSDFLQLTDINGNDLTFRKEAIWGITLPPGDPEKPEPLPPGEILIAGAARSIKVPREIAEAVKETFLA